jgi:DNA-binding phage protein
MSQSHNAIPLVPFDATRYLTNDAAITEYIAVALESGNADLLRLALADVTQAQRKAEEGQA